MAMPQREAIEYVLHTAERKRGPLAPWRAEREVRLSDGTPLFLLGLSEGCGNHFDEWVAVYGLEPVFGQVEIPRGASPARAAVLLRSPRPLSSEDVSVCAPNEQEIVLLARMSNNRALLTPITDRYLQCVG